MPKFILLRIEVESGKIMSATFANDEIEVTKITLEHEDENCYIKCLPCDYEMRKDI